jgi:hypothetical protein
MDDAGAAGLAVESGAGERRQPSLDESLQLSRLEELDEDRKPWLFDLFPRYLPQTTRARGQTPGGGGGPMSRCQTLPSSN